MVSLLSKCENHLAELNGTEMTFRKGESIFCQGGAFDSVYLIYSGSVKTYNVNHAGEECVTGFYHSNDTVGFSGIDMGYHLCSAKALEASVVYKILFVDIEKQSGRSILAHQVLQMMSRQIIENQRVISLLGSQADKKLALFLLQLAAKINGDKVSKKFFKLTMSRNDIAAYLGTRGETVSRTLTSFDSKGYIKIRGKEISITDFAELDELSS